MPTIDENVVELRLDDSQFDKASDKTIKKLDQLKQSLKFEGAVDGFEEIEKAAKKVDLSPMETGIQAVSKQFNALTTIAETALYRVTNRVLDSGERMLKSLTIDQVSQGWDKYGEKTAAVQTIMAATAKEFGNVDNQMELVEEQLEKLNWFTDETSYRFLDMVNNIGKFTSNSVKLDTSVRAMEGISTWAARSGANVTEAGRAMYNLSQAISVGAVKLMDWKSIENANMATAEFKETAIETAESLGMLVKVGDGLYQTLQGNEVSVQNFNENLSDAWFTSEVLLKTLDRYGGFADELNKLVNLTDMSTTSLIEMVDSYVDGTLDMNEAMRMTGLSAEDLTGWLEKLGDEEMKLGREAFKAAQESKTFADVIDYVKEAVGSGWMRTFEYIFGNYEEAKELWSELAEGLYEVFVASGDVRNGLLATWKEMGGRDILIDAMRKAFHNLYTIMNAFSDGFRQIFPEMTAQRLLDITNTFSRLIDYLTPTENSIENITSTVASFSSILKSVGRIISSTFQFLSPILSILNKIAGVLLSLISYFMQIASIKLENFLDSGALDRFFASLSNVASEVFNFTGNGLAKLIDGLGSVRTILTQVGSTILGIGKMGLSKIVSSITKIFEGKRNNAELKPLTILDKLSTIFPSVRLGLNSSENLISQFVSALSAAIANSGHLIDWIGNKILDFFQIVIDQNRTLGGFDLKDIAIFVGFALLLKNLSGITKGLKSVFSSLSDTISSFSKDAPAFRDTIVLQWAVLIGTLTVSLSHLTTIPMDRLMDSLLILSGAIGGLLLVIKNADKLVGDKKNQKALSAMGPFIIELGATMLILTEAISKIGSLDPLSALQGIVGLGVVLAELSGFVLLLKKFDGKLGIGTSTSLLILSTALTAMMAPIAIMGSMDLTALIQGIAGLGTVLLEIAAAALIFKTVKTTSLLGASIALNLMAPALIALSIPILAMGAMDLKSLGVGLLGLSGELAILAAGALVLSKINSLSLLGAATALNLLSTALIAASVPVFTLANLDSERMTQGLLGVLALLAELTIATAALSAIGSTAGGGTIAASASILMIATALNALVVPITVLGAMSWESLGKGLLGLAGGLGAVIAAGALAGMVAPGIAVLNTALLALAAVIGTMALLAFAISFADMAGTIVAASSSVSYGIQNLVDTVIVNQNVFPRMIGMIFDAIATLVSRFLLFIPQLVPEITLAAVSIMKAFLVGLSKVAPDIMNALLVLGLGILELVAKFADPLVDVLISMIDTLTKRLPDIVSALERFLYALGDEITNILFAVIGTIAHSLNLGPIWDWFNNARKESVKEMGNAMNDIIGVVNDKSKDIGKASSDAGINQARAYLDGYDKTMDRHSPPGEMIERAEDNGEAFKNTSLSDSVLGLFGMSGKTQANSYLSGLKNAINNGLGGLFTFSSTKKISGASAKGAANKAFSKTGINTPKTEEAISTGIEIGSAYDQGIATGIATGGSGNKKGSKTTAAVVDKAKEIEDTFKAELDNIDLSETTERLNYELWGSLNVDVEEAEKKSKQIAYVRKKIEFQVERTEIAEKKYARLMEEMGEDSKEARKAYNEWLQEQLDLANVQNELVGLQNEVADTLTESIEKINRAEQAASKEYELWQVLNINTDEATQKAKEIEYTLAKIDYQLERTKLSEEEYMRLVTEMGETASETKEAYEQWVDDQIELADLQNQLLDMRTTMIDKNNQMLDALNQSAQQAEKGFALWESVYGNIATEGEKNAFEITRLEAQLQAQISRANIAAKNWKDSVAEFGQASAQAIEAQMTYLDELNNAVELHNKLVEKQNSIEQSRYDAMAEYNRLMEEERAKMEDPDQVSMFEIFDEEEIKRYFEDAAGVTALGVERVFDTSLDSLVASAEGILSQYGVELNTGLQSITTTFGDAGMDYIEEMSQGMEKTKGDVSDAAVNVVTSAFQEAARWTNQWEYIGHLIDMGIIEGIARGESGVINRIVDMINRMIREAQRAADIHSPSGEGEYIGRMVNAGVERGIKVNQIKTGQAAYAMMKYVINSGKAAFHTSDLTEFVGKMLGEGMLAGAETYSYQIHNVSTALINDMTEEFNRTLNDQKDELNLLEQLGFSEDDLSYDMVINLDMDDPKTQLERLLNMYQEDMDMKEQARRRAADARQRMREAEHSYGFDSIEYMEAEQEYQKLQGVYETWVVWLRETMQELTDAVTNSNRGPTVSEVRNEYIQNIYSTKPLSTLDVYRNTNKLLSKFS